MTYIQLINRVLVGLREADNLVDTAATTITDAYHLFIAELVNDFLEEVENAHEWWALRSPETVTVNADTWYTALANVENSRFRVFKSLDPETGVLLPHVFDTTDDNRARLWEMSTHQMYSKRRLTPTGQDQGNPIYFAIEPWSAGAGITVWPIPTATRTLTVDLWVPQSRLDPTVEADLDATIKVPANTVALGAIWYALAERGEELGINPQIAQERYMKSLADEIAKEQELVGGDRYTLVPV